MTKNVREKSGVFKNACSRWIATCVDVFEHPVLDKGPYDRRSAWLWMIANAAWKDKTVNHKGRPLELKRGQLIAGRAFLAETWGWSEKQVRIFIELLADENMIEKGQSNGHYANVVSICNYDAYQSPQEMDSQRKGQSAASAGPEQGQTLTNTTNITGESDNAREGEKEVAKGLFVNCETIRHAAFTISLPGIQLNTLASGLNAEQVKDACLAHALQWAAEIANGKPPSRVVPDKIANFLASSIMGSRNRQSVQEVRVRKIEPKAEKSILAALNAESAHVSGH